MDIFNYLYYNSYGDLMKRPEILAPAGNIETLVAAISAGCDAVYLSGKKYGARAYAANFDDDELVEAINYAHLYDVRVYVTVNTLIYEDEMNDLLKYVEFLHTNGVDALIIQDLGAMDLIRQTYPDLELHASTQMNIHSLNSVKLIEQFGIKRAVLSRELSIDEVKHIKESTNMEIEIFVQGALCISYSGECLMSTLIGSRSGNRGTCAQCCRMKYDLIKNGEVINKDKYVLSTKDLCTLDNIGKLIDIGIDSIKIEGRMKRKEYVYLTVSLYKKAIDSYIKTGKVNITESDIKELKKIFNREFTKGFLFNEDNDKFTNFKRPNHQGIPIGKVIEIKDKYFKIKLSDELNLQDGIRIVDDDIGFNVTKMFIRDKSVNRASKGGIVKIYQKINSYSEVVKTTDYKQLQKINELIKIKRRVPIDVFVEAKIGKPLELKFKYKDITIDVVGDKALERANKNNATKEDIISKIDRLKDTVYYLNSAKIDLDDNVFIPVIFINELRRKGIELLNSKRLEVKKIRKSTYKKEVKDYPILEEKSILIDSNNVPKGYHEVYNLKDVDNTTLKLNRIVVNHKDIKKRVLVSELGSIYKYKDVVTDFGLNVTNSYTVAFLHSLGVNKVTLSYELNYNQIKNLVDSYHKRYNAHPNLEIIVNGYPEAMVCKYKLDADYLKDRFNNLFKIKIRDNYMYIYNYKKINLKEDYYKIGINSIRINNEI